MANRKSHDRRAAHRSGRGSGRQQKSGRSPAPYLAELRRRATARLRELSAALETARQEYQAAAAECARLRAPDPGGPPDADPASSASTGEVPESIVPYNEPEEIEHLVSRIEALEQKLSQTGEALAAERERRREVEDRAHELERKLRAAEVKLSEEQARANAHAERAHELQAQLESLRTQAADRQAESLEAVRSRLTDLETDLKNTKAVNARLRAEMRQLLGFLDELNGVLSAAAR